MNTNKFAGCAALALLVLVGCSSEKFSRSTVSAPATNAQNASGKVGNANQLENGTDTSTSTDSSTDTSTATSTSTSTSTVTSTTTSTTTTTVTSTDTSTFTDPEGPDGRVGAWYQANSKECKTFCTAMALDNVAEPKSGAKCAAGELRPASAVAAGIKFVYGCWPDCSLMPDSYYLHYGGTYSVGNECYHPGEKQDHDGTDRTVACYCE